MARIIRRTRARHHDLRREVLLKNFMRDQMAYIPLTRTESIPKCESTEEESSSSDEELNELDPKINGESSSAVVDNDIAQNISSTSSDDNSIKQKHDYKDDINETEELDVVTIDNNFVRNSNNNNYSSSLVKFTGLFKRNSKSSTSKGIFKAKNSRNTRSSMRTRSFKKSFEKVFYGRKRPTEKSSSQTHKNSSRSLFSLFKHRKEQRHAKDNDRTKESSANHIPTKSNTLNQSVQTDNSWVKEEMTKVHQSNKRLKEENKLLSESLSYFMSNTSNEAQQRQCSSSYQSYNRNENSLMFHDYSIPPSSSNQNMWNSRSKVTRSNSAHEFNERHKMLRNNYRTKSMNAHNSRNYFLTNSRPLLSSYSDVPNTPRSRNKNILSNLPNTSSNRNIQRHSSMPERRYRENDNFVSYGYGRSNSMRNTHTRKPFYALSSDAFY